MTARVLCPGPSLSAYDPAGFDGLTLGVNRAVLRFPCHVWSCLDWRSESGGQLGGAEAWGPAVIGAPVLLSRRESLRSLGRHGFRWRGETAATEDLRGFCPVPDYDLFSFPAALVFAARAGANRIDVFGCDWSGTLDYDGAAAGGNRAPVRWARERGVVECGLLPWLSGIGVEVHRHAVTP